MYTDHELIEKLIDYYNRFNKSPTKREFKKPNFTTYVNHFGSWNNALEAAGLPLNHNVTNTPNICRICKTTKAISWYNQNGYKVCNKCNNRDRNYFYGILDPNSNTGIAVTTEHVCFKVLNDCIKCNTINNFNSQFDLISEKYGNVNVKSSKLFNDNCWHFKKNLSSIQPDIYFCIGFDNDRSEILKVFIIPGNSDLVKKYGINIINNNSKRTSIYEIDSTYCNDIYINLDISTLPEFQYSLYNKYEEILEEDLGYDLDLLDEDDYIEDEDYKELCRIRREDIRYINGDR